MMDALTYITTKYSIDLKQKSPIEIPNTDRESLAHLFGLLEYKRGVEVGVEQGLYSEVLLRENPILRLTCVDAWQAYRGYRDHVNQEKLDGFYLATQERLKPYGERVSYLRRFSVAAAQSFRDGSLDCVYLDGNHSLPSFIDDLRAWLPKIRVGGIIAGHDYCRFAWPNQIHVVQGLNAWTDAYEVAPWFLLGTKAKVEGQKRDTSRSWFWVIPEPKSVKTYKGIVKA